MPLSDICAVLLGNEPCLRHGPACSLLGTLCTGADPARP